MHSPINFVINNGRKIPSIGLGTFQIKDPESVILSLDAALAAGYRLIDTASVYKNEVHIGNCLPQLLKKHKLNRNDVFITTKLSPRDLGSETVLKAVDVSLKNLQIDFVDLYLIHWPGKQGIKGEDTRNKQYRKDAWLALEELYKTTNKVKAIGVSNYTLQHLTEMLDYATVLPAVLQMEFHPDYYDIPVMEFCREHDIHVQAYSSLGQSKLISDDRFKPFALKYDKSIPQVLLRWGLQNNCSVIPKSSSPSHILANMNIFDFEIENSDMESIEKCGKNIKYAWDPHHVL